MSKIHDLIKEDQAEADAKVSNVPVPVEDHTAATTDTDDVPAPVTIPDALQRTLIATDDLSPDQSPSTQLGITGVLRDSEPITDIIDPDPITAPDVPTTPEVPTDPPILRDL